MRSPRTLPAPVAERLERLGRTGIGRARASDVREAIDAVLSLPPESALTSGAEIRSILGLRGGAWSPFDPWRRLRHEALLRRGAGLEWLLLWHADGYLREAATDAVDGPLPSPFAAVALAVRLNDWVAEVRAAAVRAVARCFPATDACLLAPAALVLIRRSPDWGRWSGEKAVLHHALNRDEVIAAVAAEIGGRAHGPMSSLLSNALRWEAMERHLQALLREARQPSVRAAAFEAIARGRVRLFAGHERKWLDKSAGLWTVVPAWTERPLTASLDREWALERAATDRAVAPRKAAAQALIDCPFDSPASLGLLARLAEDPNPAVRSRALFALRKRSGT